MNVIKLLRCRWKHPMRRRNHYVNLPDYRVVNYYVQYERIDHIRHPITDNTGYVYKHEDAIDREIYKALREVLPHEEANELQILTSEGVLYRDYEERERALCSNMAVGSNFQNLEINTQTIVRLVNLFTRVQFSDMAVEDVRNVILPTIPRSLNLNIPDRILTLVSRPFMERGQVDIVLERNNW